LVFRCTKSRSWLKQHDFVIFRYISTKFACKVYILLFNSCLKFRAEICTHCPNINNSHGRGATFLCMAYGASELESHATDRSWRTAVRLATWPLLHACRLPSVTSTSAARYERSLDLNVALLRYGIRSPVAFHLSFLPSCRHAIFQQLAVVHNSRPRLRRERAHTHARTHTRTKSSIAAVRTDRF